VGRYGFEGVRWCIPSSSLQQCVHKIRESPVIKSQTRARLRRVGSLARTPTVVPILSDSLSETVRLPFPDLAKEFGDSSSGVISAFVKLLSRSQ